jgi:hypothetical protein
MLAITYMKITKIRVAEWGTPKKIFKKTKKRHFETIFMFLYLKFILVVIFAARFNFWLDNW